MDREALKYEFYIGAGVEEVWNAFISPEGTRKTFFGCVLQSTFEQGAPFQYVGPGQEGDETVHVYGTILNYEPLKEISYLEHPGASYQDNHAELESRVTFTLDTVGACTKLTLVNDGWTPGHPSYENAKSHWWMILSNIKTVAETGKALDFGW
ncbi:SRPBCC family protein [Paenibacillus mucilaginosus]|uniref:Activator of Hsp90 ATPase 1 family protein n=2 Tax=Paenibacillus mucilaginosus TaxID=61624 RepID=H6N8S1_9BACL|nr:SRPBCC family protein [Paenibacillus mucilaginosus]AEI38878.1 Activator of Hsp90 ATPase 1 family protein [Paenibacillus mucilaginosus KNP414]AFC27195.1 Activator of Hsp90 ATPase 1 family protein [Paenibacillus mucilaginosus 3016]MCG7217299.1 SRPBCC family protein [Paenibacillus mucilaginosus]WDM27942.1 SRPBCC family protein [Paenibacillus mucilaginosus]WFA16119.1 polyketide cyclase [Paenibacillus mucilaginosus]